MDCIPEVISLTPTVNQLIEPIHLNCLTEGCLAVFQNTGNLHMHMLKHHHINISTHQSEMVEKRFFCPDKLCKYNICKNRNYFSTKKLLRQHYTKVHAIKTIKCNHCDKLFATNTLKNVHERRCLDDFKCDDCGWTYNSRESLLTHCRRKNHSIRKQQQQQRQNRPPPELLQKIDGNKIQKNTKIVYKLLPKIIVGGPTNNKEKLQKSQNTQTLNESSKSTNTINCDKSHSNGNNSREFLDNWNKRIQQPLASIQQQTAVVHPPIKVEQNCQTIDYYDDTNAEPTLSQNDKNLNKINFLDDETSSLNYFGGGSSALCHIETQTELFCKNYEPSPSSSLSATNAVNSDNLDSLLYTNMYTRTCDDIFSELGLADIQTQTNWQSNEYSEMFVSTETQTSFSANFLENQYTQTVFDDDADDIIVCGVNPDGSNSGVFKEFGKNNSQSTQTAFENCLREID